jgi:hypothetical protein
VSAGADGGGLRPEAAGRYEVRLSFEAADFDEARRALRHVARVYAVFWRAGLSPRLAVKGPVRPVEGGQGA